MFTLLEIYFMIAFLAVLGLLGYYSVYTRKINSHIQSGEVSGKKLVGIPRIITVFVIAFLSFGCVVLSFYLLKDDEESSRNDFAIINIVEEDEDPYQAYGGNPRLNDPAYAGLYSKKSNAGYDKEVIKDGDYIFTIFKRTSFPDNFHPDFLCFAEYMGKRDDLYVSITSSFVSASDTDHHLDNGGVSDHLLFIGNLDPGFDFKIHFDLIDKAAKESFKASSAEVTIRLN